MIQFYYAYQPIIDFFLLSVGFGYSQQIALRAGVFSIATAGFAALGSYCVAILATKTGVPIFLTVILGTALAAAVGGLLALPLARLRGAFQAIATLAFVQIILSLLLYGEGFTGGALGIGGIGRRQRMVRRGHDEGIEVGRFGHGGVEGFRHFARGEVSARHAVADGFDAEIGKIGHLKLRSC